MSLLNSIISRIKANWTASNEPIIRQRLEQQIAALLATQFADAKHKQQNYHLWGNNGDLVAQAARQCQQVLNWPQSESRQQYFMRVTAALAELAEIYRRNPHDPDGYALGTVREVEIAMQKLAENH